MTTYIGIRNVPGYLPDDEPHLFDTAAAAWASHLADRMLYEEQQQGYETLADYTDVVRLLAYLAGETSVPGGIRPPFTSLDDELHRDKQVVAVSILEADGVHTGLIKVRTSLPFHTDYDTELGEVYEVNVYTEED